MKATHRNVGPRVPEPADRGGDRSVAGSAPARTASGPPWRVAVIAVLLVALAVGAFWPVTHADFLNYDDHDYVHENPRVLSGLSWDNVIWAFTTTWTSNWHPLTWLSHMLDCELFGARPGWHHAMNLAIHALNTVLLFLLLRRMNGSEATAHAKDFPLWAGAFVAALFAVHPLHVESVAWISERKDLLSGLFFFLSLWAYVRYAAQRTGQQSQAPPRSRAVGLSGSRGAARCARRGWPDYGLAVAFFVLGLMSKPMLVTLPFVLLLLDYWPLRRLNLSLSARAIWPLVREKLPFFALTLLSCVITFVAQRKGGSVQTLDAFPLSARIENAFVSYARYLGKTFWPVNLANPYPHPGDWPGLWVWGSAILVLALCCGAVWLGRRHRHVFSAGFGFGAC